ncbi:MAG: molybdopterin biosynthesis protein [Planctomycetales bacterium]|nr:molybdopterin biosynthesis protein [Planctomycetales bacterium]
MPQDQFLDVIDCDEAEQRFRTALKLAPLGSELVSLDQALGRVLAEDAFAAVDVPSFDRSNVDGYAVVATDTFGSSEEIPRRLLLLPGEISAGSVPEVEVGQGRGATIATGGMIPRGADAVVMVEQTDVARDELLIRRAVTAGANISFAATDISADECVVHAGTTLTSRETGVLAAVGIHKVSVWRRPRVAIFSTGDEIIAPGEPMQPGKVYDSNARILADAVRELGGEPVALGIVRDNAEELRKGLHSAVRENDVVLLSGGTSKGAGDISYRVVSELTDPGIVAHGVALKPGKPICLAVTQGKPVVVLPGFPTSAIFTFHEFVAPVIRQLSGQPSEKRNTVKAQLAVKVTSEIGRTEYLLVGLVEQAAQSLPSDHSSLIAYPMGKGSGSVTTFSRADGFITIGRHEEIVAAGAPVDVQLLGKELKLADLVAIGSHCVGLDHLLSQLERQGFKTKLLAVGSTAGLSAAKRGECDLAGIHLLDPASGEYNWPFVTPDLELIPGYGRMQGIVCRFGDKRLEGKSVEDIIQGVSNDSSLLMVNRNAGSGTRILSDRLLAGAAPPGYANQPRSHNAVAAAIKQGRADWGICIESVARQAGLTFIPIAQEQYDFIIPKSRLERPAVVEFRRLLKLSATRQALSLLQLTVADSR